MQQGAGKFPVVTGQQEQAGLGFGAVGELLLVSLLRCSKIEIECSRVLDFAGNLQLMNLNTFG